MDMYQKRKIRQEKKERNTEESLSKVGINWYPGHMAKTKKQIIEDLKLIDVVIEVLDARIPISSKNPDIEQYIINKKKIIILNKSDLADDNLTKKWIQFYKDRGIIAIAIEANKSKGINEIIPEIKKAYEETSEKYLRKGRIGRTAKVMILGIPNVGKSTIINSLSKRGTAKVANRPGVTTKKQWISLDKDIDLMDTPGMLWPRLNDSAVAMNLAFVNTIGQNAIDNQEIAYYLLELLIQNYKEKVEKRYEISIENKEEPKENIKENSQVKSQKNIKENNQEIENELNLEDSMDNIEKDNVILNTIKKIATKKGCILPGGKINEQKVANMIITDFQSGKIGRITLEVPRKK